MSITIASTIVLVAHNVILFGYFMPFSHGVNKKTPLSASAYLIFSYHVFTKSFCCFTRNTLLTFLCSDQNIVKDNAVFKVKQIFSFNWLVLILLFCLYVFSTTAFHSFFILKLRINNLSLACYPIWCLIKSCDITKGFMVLKLQTVAAFLVSMKKKFEVDTTSIILS